MLAAGVLLLCLFSVLGLALRPRHMFAMPDKTVRVCIARDWSSRLSSERPFLAGS